jgi:hypothetical protein
MLLWIASKRRNCHGLQDERVDKTIRFLIKNRSQGVC